MSFITKALKHTDLVIGAVMLLIVSMLILPLPHWALDLGLVLAMSVAVVILLTSVNVKDPLQFSVFPSMLLITTLFRLALSIAATKLILGEGDAGMVIHTFGSFVLGGNFVVGFIAFIILMIVQFIVITNGATRVSEVVARFTLDAMPGKQMAIDADLGAGLIDEDEARRRRKAVKQEADFYGAMDGASKFVKGDAVASILIIIVNIIGGFAIGFMKGGGDIQQILSSYAMLSVGEGLVSQIPALLISTASGLLVTRAGQEAGMGGTLIGQLLGQPKVLASTGVALFAFGFIPGFPTLIFMLIGGLMFGISKFATANPTLAQNLTGDTPKKAESHAPSHHAPQAPTGPEAALSLVGVDTLEIEIGYSLTKLADTRIGGDLPERVTATRRQIALELGFIMPSVRIRDNAGLAPNEYIIKIRGEEVGRSFANPDELLAISSGNIYAPIMGAQTTEPVFGLEAIWIDPAIRDSAEINGYTVVEPSAMIATHLSEIVKLHAAEILTRQDVTTLVEHAKESNEAVVNELIPSVVQIGDVQKILQHLLRERIPIRDLITILETMADFAGRVKDNEQMGELVRAAIARTISRQYMGESSKLTCITIDPALERIMSDGVQHTAGGVLLALEPALQQTFLEQTQRSFEQVSADGQNPVLLCSSSLRLPVRKLLERYMPQLPVMAYNEVSAKAEVEFVGQVAMVA